MTHYIRIPYAATTLSTMQSIQQQNKVCSPQYFREGVICLTTFLLYQFHAWFIEAPYFPAFFNLVYQSYHEYEIIEKIDFLLTWQETINGVVKLSRKLDQKMNTNLISSRRRMRTLKSSLPIFGLLFWLQGVWSEMVYS